jgi:hypothetical protein
MPLSEYEQLLLFELYQIPMTDTAVTNLGGSNYFGSTSYSTDNRSKQQLTRAIETINQSAAKVMRVKQILEEYLTFSTDPSNIDNKGYSFRASKSRNALLIALQPVTGIMISYSGSNRTRLG